MREIIVDNFAGGGGASTGIEMAIGRSVDIAINHDPNAIAMHTTNHPDTLHYCESVFDIDPVAATSGAPVGLAWIVLRWALATRPRVMMLENVEEFKTWGPLLADEATGFRDDQYRQFFSKFIPFVCRCVYLPLYGNRVSEMFEGGEVQRG